MKKAMGVVFILCLTVTFYGCVLSVSPDTKNMVVMDPGQTQIFEIKSSGTAAYYRDFSIYDISTGEPVKPAHAGDFSIKTNDDTLVDSATYTPDMESAGVYKIEYSLKAWSEIAPALEPLLTMANSIHSRTWKVMVRGISLTPKHNLASPPGTTMTYEAKAYPEKDYTYRWMLDEEEVGTGARYDFTPAKNECGRHTLVVTATLGNTVYRLSRDIFVPAITVDVGADSSLASLHPTPDNGFIVATQNASDIPGSVNHGGADIHILKFNDAGVIEWQKLYGGESSESPYSIAPLNGGGYIVSGKTESEDIPSDAALDNLGNVYVLKIDNRGEMIWQKRYGPRVSRSISPTAGDTGFISVGTQVMLLDAVGAIVWSKSDYVGYAVSVTPDNGFIILGEKSGTPAIFKLDAFGNELWSQPVDASFDHSFQGNMTPDGDGGVIAILNDNDWSDNTFRNSIIRITTDGAVSWIKTYNRTDSPDSIEFCSLGKRPEGGYWAAGTHRYSTLCLLEVDPSGNLLDGSPIFMGGLLEINRILAADVLYDGSLMIVNRPYFINEPNLNTNLYILNLNLSDN